MFLILSLDKLLINNHMNNIHLKMVNENSLMLNYISYLNVNNSLSQNNLLYFILEQLMVNI